MRKRRSGALQQILDRARGQVQPAAAVGVVDLRDPAARDRDPQVARDREHGRRVLLGIEPDQHQRVRPRVAAALAVAPVRADQQQRLRLARRRRRDRPAPEGLRVPLVAQHARDMVHLHEPDADGRAGHREHDDRARDGEPEPHARGRAEPRVGSRIHRHEASGACGADARLKSGSHPEFVDSGHPRDLGTRADAAQGLLARHSASHCSAGRGARSPAHADTESIIGFVREELGGVSRQAVYDVLRALTAAGLLRRIQPRGSVARYEARVRRQPSPRGVPLVRRRRRRQLRRWRRTLLDRIRRPRLRGRRGRGHLLGRLPRMHEKGSPCLTSPTPKLER